jgi:putative heme transporter
MLAPEQTIQDFALPTIDLRALARRAVVPAVLAAAALATVLLLGGRVHAFADALKRAVGVDPGWAIAAIGFECISIAGYVALLSLVAGRATSRIGLRESAQITLAGAAATRVLPTAGAGGAALTLWALRRAGLGARSAAHTLLVFLVLLYAVFLASIVLAGAALALGVTSGHGPLVLSALPAAVAIAGIGLALSLGRQARRRAAGNPETGPGLGHPSRLGRATRLLGEAVSDAIRLVRSGEPRLAGAVVYWLLDAAVLWSMLHAFGAPPAVPVVILAYFVGQVANTLPLPGTVSGGIAGVLLAFGVPAGLALPAVLAYRTVAVWLPTPVALAALPSLRSTIARWKREGEREEIKPADAIAA